MRRFDMARTLLDSPRASAAPLRHSQAFGLTWSPKMATHHTSTTNILPGYWPKAAFLATGAVALLLAVTIRAAHQQTVAPERPSARAEQKLTPKAKTHDHVVARPRDQEPAWLARHREITRASAQAHGNEVLLLGDSLTQGWNLHRPMLAAALGGRPILNAGIASDRVEHILWRVEHGAVSSQRPPAVVVLMAGINNMGDTSPVLISDGLRATVAAIKARAPATKILLVAILPSGRSPNHAWRARIAATNTQVRAMASMMGVTFIDPGPAFLDQGGTLSRRISFDGVHLTAAGYGIWAQALRQTLPPLLFHPSPLLARHP